MGVVKLRTRRSNCREQRDVNTIREWMRLPGHYVILYCTCIGLVYWTLSTINISSCYYARYYSVWNNYSPAIWLWNLFLSCFAVPQWKAHYGRIYKQIIDFLNVTIICHQGQIVVCCIGNIVFFNPTSETQTSCNNYSLKVSGKLEIFKKRTIRNRKQINFEIQKLIVKQFSLSQEHMLTK